MLINNKTLTHLLFFYSTYSTVLDRIFIVLLSYTKGYYYIIIIHLNSAIIYSVDCSNPNPNFQIERERRKQNTIERFILNTNI